MKIKLIYALVLLISVACGSSSGSTNSIETKSKSSIVKKKDVIYISNNKSFEVTFKDDQFYSWLAKQPSKSQYLQSSLEIVNFQYVTEWNRRVDNSDYNLNLYIQQIDYQIRPREHYGIDVNYELYMYFKFFEEKHEILLM